MRRGYTGRLTAGLTMTYRTPIAQAQALRPAGLELVTRGRWAFLQVAAFRLEHLLPTGVPGCDAVDGCVMAYRLHTQVATDAATWVPGLFTARVDAPAALLDVLRTRRSVPQWHRAAVSLEEVAEGWRLTGDTLTEAGAVFDRSIHASTPRLARDSAFASVADALDLATRTTTLLSPADGAVRLATERPISGGRWTHQPVTLDATHDAPPLPGLRALGQHHAALELVTALTPVDMAWRPARPVRPMSGGALLHRAMPHRAPSTHPRQPATQGTRPRSETLPKARLRPSA